MVIRKEIIKQPDKITFFNYVYKLQKEYQEALILDNSNPDLDRGASTLLYIGERI